MPPPDPVVELRLARPDELAAVGALTVRVYVDAEGFIPADAAYVTALGDTRARAEAAELWVAVDDDLVLGTVTFCPSGSTMREVARTDEGEFRMLAVAPEARGRGVGRALVELCLRRSRVLGFSGVRISSLADMASAHRIYASLGFTRSPEDDWSPEPGVALLAYRLGF